MLYKDIFARINGGDTISVTIQSVNFDFQDNPHYISFTNEKLKFRKYLESKYLKRFNGRSFRVYLEHLVFQVFYQKKHQKNNDLSAAEQSFETEILAEVGAFIDSYLYLESDLIEFFLKSNNRYSIKLKEIGLDQYFLYGHLTDLYLIKNGRVNFCLTFALNEETKTLFIDHIVDDWHGLLPGFKDPVIKRNGEVIYYSDPHKDFYFFGE